jgi:hypothetical protein
METERKLIDTRPSRETATAKKAPSGAEDMRAAADLFLQQHCMEIAKALVDSAKNGHIQSSRFLYVLADEKSKIGNTEVEETAFSLAQELMREPPWPGDPNEDPVETYGGWIDPEGQR